MTIYNGILHGLTKDYAPRVGAGAGLIGAGGLTAHQLSKEGSKKEVAKKILNASQVFLPAPAKGLLMAGAGALAPKKSMAKITKGIFEGKKVPIPKSKAEAKRMIKEIKMNPEKRKALEKAKVEEISKDKFKMGIGRGALIGTGLTGAALGSLPYYGAYRYGKKKGKKEAKNK